MSNGLPLSAGNDPQPGLHAQRPLGHALGLAGRIPLKFGHGGDDARDGAPALGWVTRVHREGRKLLADFADIPRTVYDAIKAGLYKFVSVELLRDVRAGTRQIPYVLDAVALLGATPPAVGTLRDLQSLTMRRRPQLQFGSRLSFARDGEGEAEVLRTENRRLQAQLLAQAQDADVQAHRVLRAEVERFTRRYRDTATLADWRAWVETAPPVPERFRRGATAATRPATDIRDELPADATPDVEVLHLSRAEVEKSGGKLSLGAAQQIVLRRDPELAERYRMQPGIRVQ